MNVDWDWIKQRPHFIAEGLATKNEIKVIYQYRYQRDGLQNNDRTVPLAPIYVIPKIDNLKYFNRINLFIKKNFVERQIKNFKPNIIYLTYPTQIYSIPDDYAGKIVYDCMDDHLAINNKSRESIFKAEKILVQRANIVITSSKSLKNKLENRYNISRISIVRNGFNGPILEIKQQQLKRNKHLTLAYIGTISHWFDTEVIKKSLKEIPELNYLLIGPFDAGERISDPRVNYMGTVNHNQLFNKIKNVDALIMPFQVNQIIESVDPVKLYEYINFNKDILSVEYDEIERFNSFVHFYKTYENYIAQLRELMQAKSVKYTDADRKEFLEKNSWLERVREVNSLLRRL